MAKYYKEYELPLNTMTYANAEKENANALDLSALHTFVEVDGSRVLSDYALANNRLYNVTAPQVATDAGYYLELGYVATITPWVTNGVFKPVEMEFTDVGRSKMLKEQFGKFKSFDINRELYRRVSEDATGSIRGVPTVATFIVAEGEDVLESTKYKTCYGSQIYDRIFGCLYQICSTYRQMGVARIFRAQLVDGLPITKKLLVFAGIPQPEDIGDEFGTDMSLDNKFKAGYNSMRKRGLCTRYVPYNMIKLITIRAISTLAGSGTEMKGWFLNFVQHASSNGVTPEEVLLALAYMYSGKFEDKELSVLTGDINGEERTIEKEKIKNLVYKGKSIKENSNIIRAYKSFVVNGYYKTMLGPLVIATGPYSFNKNLPYMFYYDAAIDVDEFYKLFQMMVNAQKNIRLVASVKSLNGLLKTLKAIKPEIIDKLSSSKDPLIKKYMKFKTLVNKNTASNNGEVLSDMEIDKKSQKMMNTVIAQSVGKSISQRLKKDDKMVNSLMKNFGLDF